MDRHRISRIAHTGHPIAAPLTGQAVADVLNHALNSELPETRALDRGCGGAEWLLRALEHHPGSSGVGVDIAEPAVAHARAEAHRRGLAERLRIEPEDAAGFGLVLQPL